MTPKSYEAMHRQLSFIRAELTALCDEALVMNADTYQMSALAELAGKISRDARTASGIFEIISERKR